MSCAEPPAMERRYRGGMRADSANYTWPFVVLHVGPDELRMEFFGREYRIRRCEIVRLSRYDGWFSKGIQITHSSSSVPQKLVFWTMNRDSVMSGLEYHRFVRK